MDRTALRHAWERLQQAENACTALQGAQTLGEIERAWSAFLSAASAIYSKLEKGAKGTGSCEGWFGRIKHERRTDPLLSYIHHARNADEHGIVDITERVPGVFAISGDVHIHHLAVGPNGIAGRASSINPARPARIHTKPAQVKLAAVFDDRFNDAFDVPTEHLGKPLRAQSPQEVAALGLEYLKQLVKAASEYAN
jgi:hypothetical protein